MCRPQMIRVIIPFHLRMLAQVRGDVELEIEGEVTQRSILDALEARYPMLRGAIRDQVTLSGALSCASSPASRISLTNRPMLHCPTKLCPARSPLLSSERLPADK